jgi:hypothetical protein
MVTKCGQVTVGGQGEASAMLLRRRLRRSEAAALAMGRVERRKGWCASWKGAARRRG